MRIGAPAPHRELDGVRLAEDDHAGGDEPLGEGGRDRRHTLGPHLRPARGEAPLEVDEVLEGDGHAVERPHAVAGTNGPIGAFGGQARLGLVDGDEGVQDGITAANALEERIDGVDGRERARGEGAGQLGHGGPYGIDPGHWLLPPSTRITRLPRVAL